MTLLGWHAFLREWWHIMLVALNVGCAVAATSHAVLYKRDSRSAAGWVGLIWLAPVMGAALYLALGVNRLHRRARALRIEHGHTLAEREPCPDCQLERRLGPERAHLLQLAELVGSVTHAPLLPGNEVTPLIGGPAAYPQMLEAIEQARAWVTLGTYIFDDDDAGQQFVAALGRAVARGVRVRVLIDDMGARYSFPRVRRRLRDARVTAAHFLPTWFPWHLRYSNMRNHRKLLVVDGRLAFTGGMNIRAGNLLRPGDRHPVRDVHFRLTGPIVRSLQATFADDWVYTTGESMAGEDWRCHGEHRGPVLARGIPDGPDDDFEKLRMTLLGALACARRSVWVATPYFLPDSALVSALNVAAMRGVTVDILLPERNNLRLVGWASHAGLWQLVERCRIWFTPPPFDHTKLMIVDDFWSLIGSANWDQRSLRLNFEYDVECYDEALAAELVALLRGKIDGLRPQTRAQIEGIGLVARLRNGVARLLTPYL